MIKKLTTFMIVSIAMIPFYSAVSKTCIKAWNDTIIIKQAIEYYYQNIEDQANEAFGEEKVSP